MPQSSKVVVLDAELSIASAFEALLENGLNATVVYSLSTEDYVSLVNQSDFLFLLTQVIRASIQRLSTSGSETEEVDEEELLEDVNRCVKEHSLNDAFALYLDDVPYHRPASLILGYSNDSLRESSELLCRSWISTLPVVSLEKDKLVLYLLEPRRLVSFLFSAVADLSLLLDDPLELTPTPKNESVSVCYPSTPLSVVLDHLCEHKLVPIVEKQSRKLLYVFTGTDLHHLRKKHHVDDGENVVYVEFSRFIVRHRATPLSSLIDLSSVPISDQVSVCVVDSHQPAISATLTSLITRFLDNRITSLVLVDSAFQIVSLLSLNDILNYFISLPDADSDDAKGSPYFEGKLHVRLVVNNNLRIGLGFTRWLVFLWFEWTSRCSD
eukprot:TRINITY_DN1646_c0_g1_i1.p1 TRINITY_DN1646_c0_g1~~TRINITY_DN1646_c0_g1_i1.p1  ORF type:complete len:382 (-),score=50.52 TRINITY_DN1646_c0_g1_i1:260-1405(-)